MLDAGEAPHESYAMLADLLLELGDTAAAADALEGAMYVNPYEMAQHARLATLYSSLKQHAKAVRERRAVVALRPVDRAEALYQLAVAYREAGDEPNARRSVLRALEEAPHFEKAQQLLLSLRRTP
jgi:Tfp pilus assembly protein PilF